MKTFFLKDPLFLCPVAEHEQGGINEYFCRGSGKEQRKERCPGGAEQHDGCEEDRVAGGFEAAFSAAPEAPFPVEKEIDAAGK